MSRRVNEGEERQTDRDRGREPDRSTDIHREIEREVCRSKEPIATVHVVGEIQLDSVRLGLGSWSITTRAADGGRSGSRRTKRDEELKEFGETTEQQKGQLSKRK